MMLDLAEYKSIFEILPVPSLVLAPSGGDARVAAANEAYLDVTRLDRSQVLNKDLLADLVPLLAVKSESLKSLLAVSIAQVKKRAEAHHTDIELCRIADSSGSRECFWQFTHTPVMNEAGEIRYLIHTLEDMTDQFTEREKQERKTRKVRTRSELQGENEDLEMRIARKMAQYEAASEELNDFIYSVSHDLRAPLRRIDGFSQELVNEYLDQLDETGAHYLKRVRQGAQDMGNLIDDLLKLSRISRREPEFEEVDISRLAKTVFDDLIELKRDNGIDLQVEKDLRVEADRGLVKAMLTNLLSNAIKFSSGEEQPVIQIGTTIRDTKKLFFIKDNGVGFDPRYSDKLFNAFDRLHSQKEFEGSGIGLATVKRIINLHGGEIWADSTPGEGATFYFNFRTET
ncbi:ATP-binding protein [Halalkalibaculum sp. DA3122]|uniref:sensor histidine kinase n=1 Tax=Halalkalibaculum sp. DA3122 TaxID=3373607 RepID=UPI0037546314